MYGTTFDKPAMAASMSTGRRGAIGLAAGLVAHLTARGPAAAESCKRKARRSVDECKELRDRDCPLHDCKGDAGRKCNRRHNDIVLGVSCDSQAPAVCAP